MSNKNLAAKITFLIGGLRGGGAERNCIMLANGFAESGIAVDLLVLNLQNAVYQDDLDPRVKLIDLQVLRAKNSIPALARYIRSNSPGHILVFNDHLAAILILLRFFLGLKAKIIARNINTLSVKFRHTKPMWKKYVVGSAVKLLYRHVDLIIAQSHGMRDDLIQNFAIADSKVAVIHNPVGPKIESYSATQDIKKSDYLLCVGRLEEAKAFHYAITAFARISTVFPDLRLKIAGTGSLEHELRSLATALGIENKVDFAGFQRDLIPYYLQAKATVLTSLFEGFPNVLLESLALGTPVVAFDCPSGPAEIVQDGINGYLVAYKDVDMLADRLRTLLLRGFEPTVVKQSTQKFASKRIVQQYIKAMLEAETL